MTFHKKLAAIVTKNNSLLCVGLDSDVTKIPSGQSQFEFNKNIIDSTHDLVCAYKPNPAFYEAHGAQGVEQLKKTCDYLRQNYPDIPIIIDAKRGDIGNTNTGYMQYVFDYYHADAMTVMPYLGIESLSPYFDRKDKGIIVGCHSSNPGAKEFQDLLVSKSQSSEATGSRNGRIGNLRESALRMEGKNSPIKPLYQHIAKELVKQHGSNPNVMMFMGATYPKQLEEIRAIVGEMTLLIPGVGAQGGETESTVKAGLNSKKAGIIVNSSRGIIFSENPRSESQKLRDEINSYR